MSKYKIYQSEISPGKWFACTMPAGKVRKRPAFAILNADEKVNVLYTDNNKEVSVWDADDFFSKAKNGIVMIRQSNMIVEYENATISEWCTSKLQEMKNK